MTSTLSRSIRPAKLDVVASLAQPDPPAAALAAVLDQLKAVVGCLHDEQYTQKPVGVVHSSIGGHVRHCLDHVRALLNASETGQLDYDQRDRGTTIESDRAAALGAIRALRNRLDALPDDIIDRPIRLSVLMISDGAPMEVQTTFGREMAFVLSHTIHHNALIGTMVKILSGWLPDRFGYAPSTITHANGKARACAR
jgi:uncharacterized damage-inducible protein DinB